MMNRIACVILNYNDAPQVETLVQHIRGYQAIHDIVVVDNFSSDDSFSVLERLRSDKIHVCRTDRNGGYGYGNNFGVRYAREHCGSDTILIANPDVFFSEELVCRLQSALYFKPDTGVSSAIQRDRDDREVDCSAGHIPTKWRYILSMPAATRRWGTNFYYSLKELHCAEQLEVDCVAGSLLMVSAEAFLRCGGYDEDIFLYCEETVLGCKMKENGYRCVLCSDVSYRHLHGVSIGKSVSSAVGRKKLLVRSHRLVLRRYLHANRFERAVDAVLCRISIWETTLAGAVRKIIWKIKGGRNGK